MQKCTGYQLQYIHEEKLIKASTEAFVYKLDAKTDMAYGTGVVANFCLAPYFFNITRKTSTSYKIRQSR